MQNTKLYKRGFASPLLRGVEEPRPWDLQEKILALAKPNFVMLDIGSGTAEKLINIAPKFKEIVALEPSADIRELAQEIIIQNNIANIKLVDGRAEQLPFPDAAFDMVTCMLAPWKVDEIFRVLKKAGLRLLKQSDA